MDRYGGGWMVFQRRYDGSVEFPTRNWEEYKNGFGNSDGEYWLGNEMLHLLTTSQPHDYMVEGVSFQDEINYKKIRNVVINGEDDHYRIVYDLASIDSTYTSTTYGTSMRGMRFSTTDRDNDEDEGTDCASKYGGWWLNSCHTDAMNGSFQTQEETDNIRYIPGIMWNGWKGFHKSLKGSILTVSYTHLTLPTILLV